MEQAKEPIVERMAYLIRRYPSRSAAARACGININTLQSYFKKGNTPEPRESILVRIAESEGVSLEWLKTGNGNPPKTQKTQKT
ncbi:helix-turn-helix domain containing protein [Shigella flexneri]|nr:helix-turn-helix domain containing protein [Shigella flexneri]MCW3770303.1 helix-turn-helix domain containing protein [Shigella flexneri 5a str. M90T]SUI54642.1 regulatory protein [Shigella flexneri]